MQPGLQPEPAALLAVLFLPFAAAAVTPLVYRVLGERTAYFAALVAAACLGLLATQFGAEGVVVLPWIPSLNVTLTLYLDGLAFLVSLLATGVGVLIFTYSGGYMHGEPGQAKYYTTLLVFMGSMLGVALAADLIALFVFWELTSVASFVLIGHYQRTDSGKYAARKAMLITVSGGLFMLVGFLLLHVVTPEALGQSSFALFDATVGRSEEMPGMIDNATAMREALRASGLFVPALALVAVGAAAKSAQVPLHIWLPNAMEAPTPVSAFLHSATMVKAGVYLVGRVRPLFLPDAAGLSEWTLLFVALGLLTMTVTAMLAVGARDIKELLAYSTASHLGLIVAGFGFAKYGAETGSFHILNHASFKAALFLVAGIVAHEAHTRDIRELGGLWRDMPLTAAIAAVASLSMAGIPPFNGFYSKEYLFEAAWELYAHDGGVTVIVPIVAVFGSIFTFMYSIRFLMLFFGDRPAGLGEVHRPPLAMLVPTALLGVVVVALSVAPAAVGGPVIELVVEATAVGDPHFEPGLPSSLTPYVAMSAATITLGAVGYWGIGYGRIHRTVRAVRSQPVVMANTYYDSLVDGLTGWSDVVPRYVQTRMLRTYVATALLAVCALALGGYVAGGVSVAGVASLGIEALRMQNLGVPILIVLFVAVVGALAVDVAPSHVAGVLTLSILGFMVAVFYVLANAPDLALTQLVIETLLLVIFLLVLDKLPSWYGEIEQSRAVVDLGVSAVVGFTVFLTVLLSTGNRPSSTIRTFFVRTAPLPHDPGTVVRDFGGGGNVVNVILVDFRAFDTLGEISVVAMAALAVITLVGMRDRGEQS